VQARRRVLFASQGRSFFGYQFARGEEKAVDAKGVPISSCRRSRPGFDDIWRSVDVCVHAPLCHVYIDSVYLDRLPGHGEDEAAGVLEGSECRTPESRASPARFLAEYPVRF